MLQSHMLQMRIIIYQEYKPIFATILVLHGDTNGPGSPALGGVCCQSSSEVKLENTDKTNWRHSADISQQYSYLFQARVCPKALVSTEKLSTNESKFWLSAALKTKGDKKVLQHWWRPCPTWQTCSLVM